MQPEMDRERLLQTIIGQLESDQFLGGIWLPIGAIRPDISATKPQTEKDMITEPVETKEEKIKIIKAKAKKLAEIAQTVAQCKNCPLHQSRLHAVAGEGDPDARIVFVGEAPGQNEDEQGRPFVGRAGKLLTNIIEAMGLQRSEVFIGNILKCRPPNNRDPQADEIVACTGYLQEQLKVIQPEIIVALGAHAARTLLDTNKPIGQLRGLIHEYYPEPLSESIKLIATYHPAYLLRNYSRESRSRVWEDMKKVLRELHLPVPGDDKM